MEVKIHIYPFFLTEMGYKVLLEQITGGQSDTFQTRGRQSEFRSNYR